MGKYPHSDIVSTPCRGFIHAEPGEAPMRAAVVAFLPPVGDSSMLSVPGYMEWMLISFLPPVGDSSMLSISFADRDGNMVSSTVYSTLRRSASHDVKWSLKSP